MKLLNHMESHIQYKAYNSHNVHTVNGHTSRLTAKAGATQIDAGGKFPVICPPCSLCYVLQER